MDVAKGINTNTAVNAQIVETTRLKRIKYSIGINIDTVGIKVTDYNQQITQLPIFSFCIVIKNHLNNLKAIENINARVLVIRKIRELFSLNS